MRHLIAVSTAALMLAACDSKPTDAAAWAKVAVDRNRAPEKLEALKEVRKAPGDKKGAVPFLITLLKDSSKIRSETAVALAEIKDPESVQPLIDAIDFSVGAGSDRATREANEANKEIAKALGAMRAKAAVSALGKLTASRDNYTQVAAVEALGEIGDPASVAALTQLATDEGIEPFTAKKAIVALGKIGSSEAVPAVMKMMFRERKGVSFFAEASLAAFQIGQPMASPLLAVLKGEEREFETWARQNKVASGALYAKAAQVLGDLGDRRAIAPLVARLSYKDSEELIEYAVRVAAAEALGRLRAKEAVKTLSELVLKEREPNAKDRYCEALIRIGDRAAIPQLVKTAGMMPWELRESALRAIASLGDERELKVIDDAAKAEPAKTDQECKDLGTTPADCKKGKEKRAAMIAEMRARLEAAKACKGDANCWAGKLKDKNTAVRERAALEVGRLGGAAHAEALAAAILAPAESDGDLPVRSNAALALDWIASSGGLSGSAGALVQKLEALVEQERGKSFTIKVNEDVKRAAVKLRRATAKT